MKPIRVLIVDDEEQSRSLIRKLLSDHFEGLDIEEAESVSGAAGIIEDRGPQLVFLDIQMRGETGFDLLDRFSEIPFGVIFTTAHLEFAIKAFRYSAMNYLVKPLDKEEFIPAVTKALERINIEKKILSEQMAFLKDVRKGYSLPDKLTIPTAEGFLFIHIQDILYCRSISNYTEFHFSNRPKLLSSFTLGHYQEILAPHHFFRAHRSSLINLAHVKMLKRVNGGVVVMTDGEEIEVSRNNKDALMKILNL